VTGHEQHGGFVAQGLAAERGAGLRVTGVEQAVTERCTRGGYQRGSQSGRRSMEMKSTLGRSRW
jgi:hypothetical protein